MSKKLIRPSKEYVKKFLNSKERKENFDDTDKAMNLVFRSYPKNNKLYQILAKVAVLNQLYRTNIFDPFTVAQHIYSLRSSLDDKLSNGSSDIVDKIAQVTFKSKRRYVFYSFATKYCSWHYPGEYFIFDSYVEWILWEYKKKFRFADYKRNEMRDYKQFHTICLKFKSYFNLNQISNKKLDEFLWLESKRFYEEL